MENEEKSEDNTKDEKKYVDFIVWCRKIKGARGVEVNKPLYLIMNIVHH